MLAHQKPRSNCKSERKKKKPLSPQHTLLLNMRLGDTSSIQARISLLSFRHQVVLVFHCPCSFILSARLTISDLWNSVIHLTGHSILRWFIVHEAQGCKPDEIIGQRSQLYTLVAVIQAQRNQSHWTGRSQNYYLVWATHIHDVFFEGVSGFASSKDGIEHCHLASVTPQSSRQLNAYTIERVSTTVTLGYCHAPAETENKASARFRGNWAEFKMAQNFPVQQEEAAAAGKGAFFPNPDRKVPHYIKTARRLLARKHHALMF